MILPPPNVTGHLHLGHALTATIQDGLIRWWALSICFLFAFIKVDKIKDSQDLGTRICIDVVLTILLTYDLYYLSYLEVIFIITHRDHSPRNQTWITMSSIVENLHVGDRGKLTNLKNTGTIFFHQCPFEKMPLLYFDYVKSADFGSEKKNLM